MTEMIGGGKYEFKTVGGMPCPELKEKHWYENQTCEISALLQRVDDAGNVEENVAALRIFSRWLELTEEPFSKIPVLGVGGVFTKEGRRGMGFATKLLKSLIMWSMQGGMPTCGTLVVGLFTKDARLYERVGFHEVKLEGFDHGDHEPQPFYGFTLGPNIIPLREKAWKLHGGFF